MPTQVDAALIEIALVLAVLRPELEGLQDFERLNLIPEAHAQIQDAIRDYQRRQSLLEQAQTALNALAADGHPALNVRQVAPDVYADLQDQLATITAAIAKFTAERAAALRITAGSAEPKS